MIAKAKWFNRRKYTGWGLWPKTWQGWLYIFIVGGITTLILSLNYPEMIKVAVTTIWLIFVLFDALHAAASIKMDEREAKIESISERNASWTMVAAISLSLLYTATVGKNLKGMGLMPVLVFPIAAGALVKGISNYILGKRGL